MAAKRSERGDSERVAAPCDCDGSGRICCPNCYGEGFVVTCIDDLCRNSGECIHGDGEKACRECCGFGWVPCVCECGKWQGEDR